MEFFCCYNISMRNNDATRMGRPPKPPAEKYSEQANVRMTRAERRRLASAARKAGLSLSALLMKPWRKGKGG